jgi:mycothiol synthase
MSADVRPFCPEDEPDLRRVMEASLAFDRFPGHTAWDLSTEADSIAGTPDAAVLALENGVVCGFVAPRHEQLTVHPEHRRRGHGRRLFEAGLAMAARAGLAEIRLYVPTTAGSLAFARAMGLAYRSSLWRFGLAAGADVPAPEWPAAVAVRPLGDWLPLPRYVDLLNTSFADHPGPILWTLEEIEHAHARPGYDPTTTVLVAPIERPEDPIAFARIALGPDDADDADDALPVGDVRLIGVLPEWRGRGLGRELLRWAVAELRVRGAGRIQLTVEAENERALGLYRRAGFEPLVEWPHWVRPIG